jgi:hypothetical protein
MITSIPSRNEVKQILQLLNDEEEITERNKSMMRSKAECSSHS